MLGGHQTYVGADRGPGEPRPVADLHGQRRDALQATQPVDRIGEPRRGGHLQDLLVESDPGRGRGRDGIEAVVEGCPEVATLETLPTQPLLVFARPGWSALVDEALSQKQFGQPMPYPHQISTGILAGPRQIADRLDLTLGDRHFGDLTQPQQPGQMRDNRKRMDVQPDARTLSNHRRPPDLQMCFQLRECSPTPATPGILLQHGAFGLS